MTFHATTKKRNKSPCSPPKKEGEATAETSTTNTGLSGKFADCMETLQSLVLNQLIVVIIQQVTIVL